MVKPTLPKRAYHIARIVCDEVFNLSPVGDIIENLMFPDEVLCCAVQTFCQPKLSNICYIHSHILISLLKFY